MSRINKWNVIDKSTPTASQIPGNRKHKSNTVLIHTNAGGNTSTGDQSLPNISMNNKKSSTHTASAKVSAAVSQQAIAEQLNESGHFQPYLAGASASAGVSGAPVFINNIFLSGTPIDLNRARATFQNPPATSAFQPMQQIQSPHPLDQFATHTNFFYQPGLIPPSSQEVGLSQSKFEPQTYSQNLIADRVEVDSKRRYTQYQSAGQQLIGNESISTEAQLKGKLQGKFIRQKKNALISAISPYQQKFAKQQHIINNLPSNALKKSSTPIGVNRSNTVNPRQKLSRQIESQNNSVIRGSEIYTESNPLPAHQSGAFNVNSSIFDHERDKSAPKVHRLNDNFVHPKQGSEMKGRKSEIITHSTTSYRAQYEMYQKPYKMSPLKKEIIKRAKENLDKMEEENKDFKDNIAYKPSPYTQEMILRNRKGSLKPPSQQQFSNHKGQLQITGRKFKKEKLKKSHSSNLEQKLQVSINNIHSKLSNFESLLNNFHRNISQIKFVEDEDNIRASQSSLKFSTRKAPQQLTPDRRGRGKNKKEVRTSGTYSSDLETVERVGTESPSLLESGENTNRIIINNLRQQNSKNEEKEELDYLVTDFQQIRSNLQHLKQSNPVGGTLRRIKEENEVKTYRSNAQPDDDYFTGSKSYSQVNFGNTRSIPFIE